jgi:hypothetical protein
LFIRRLGTPCKYRGCLDRSSPTITPIRTYIRSSNLAYCRCATRPEETPRRNKGDQYVASASRSRKRTTMDTYGSADHHIHTETSSTLAAQEYGDEFDQIRKFHEQGHDGDGQAPRREVTEANTLLYKDARNATVEKSSNVHDQREPASIAKTVEAMEITTTPDFLSAVSPYVHVTQSCTNFVHHKNSGHDRSGSSTLHPRVDHDPDGDNPAVQPLFDTTGGFDPSKECPAHQDIHTFRFTWTNAAIVFTCSVSTFSQLCSSRWHPETIITGISSAMSSIRRQRYPQPFS